MPAYQQYPNNAYPQTNYPAQAQHSVIPPYPVAQNNNAQTQPLINTQYQTNSSSGNLSSGYGAHAQSEATGYIPASPTYPALTRKD
mmetsp:Transcript_5255/g.5039  ORF Transcript_5255/g.5039 Transcript_5255/m.5039 type:complete len:86 (+) Transcript_5255:571-828(+)